MTRILYLIAFAAGPALVYGADTPNTIGKVLDSQLRGAEREIVSLAEAMPAGKYDFHPTHGEFANVRSFSLQMSHIAAVLYEVSAAALGEKNPTDMGKDENGPASLQGKDAVVKYLKDAFAYAHRATSAVTTANAMEMVQSPFGGGQTSRMDLVAELAPHSFDHYGQAVVYARMNGVIPPASRPK